MKKRTSFLALLVFVVLAFPGCSTIKKKSLDEQYKEKVLVTQLRLLELQINAAELQAKRTEQELISTKIDDETKKDAAELNKKISLNMVELEKKRVEQELLSAKIDNEVKLAEMKRKEKLDGNRSVFIKE